MLIRDAELDFGARRADVRVRDGVVVDSAVDSTDPARQQMVVTFDNAQSLPVYVLCFR